MKYIRFHKRAAAFAAAVFIAFILFGTSFFVLTNLEHDCPGHDCQTCQEISLCLHTLHQLTEAVGAGVMVIFACICSLKFLLTYLTGFFLTPSSLVRLKIRLNN